jgi:hypothetical protein
MRFVHAELLNKYCEVLDFNFPILDVNFLFKQLNYTVLNFEENKTNKMLKLILGLIYYFSITSTCFGPSIKTLIREYKILEGYEGSRNMSE